MAHLNVGRPMPDRTPVGQCPVRPVAHRTAAALAAVRVAAHPVAGIPHPDTAATTNRFSPRFTPHLTHRQEAPQGASCPPQLSGGEGIRASCITEGKIWSDVANTMCDLGVELF